MARTSRKSGASRTAVAPAERIWKAAVYAGVIIGTSPENLENQGFCRLNPIFYARVTGKSIMIGGCPKAEAVASAFDFASVMSGLQPFFLPRLGCSAALKLNTGLIFAMISAVGAICSMISSIGL